jgi:hypothetical protein
MAGQNKTKGIKKLLMAKKARNKACPEEEATGSAMADHLGRHKLKKDNLAGPSVSMPRRITGIITSCESMT